MTDPLTVVRDADPVRDLTLDADAAARLDAGLERLLTTERVGLIASGPSRSTRQRWALVAGGLVTATAAVAVTLAALPSGTRTTNPIAPAPASAAEALTRLQQTAAAAPAATDPYVYIHTLTYSTHLRPRPDGRKGSFATVIPSDNELWVAQDGSSRTVRSHDNPDQATYPTDQDRADAAQAGPLPPLSSDGEAYRYKGYDVMGYSVEELKALPTDPAALRRELQAHELPYDADLSLVALTGQVLSSPLTPPAVRAAAFAVLKGLPGATLRPGAQDPRGRTGEGVEFESEAWRTLFIFDPQTSAVIATRSIGKKELPGRTIGDWQLQLEASGTDRAPEAVDGDAQQREFARMDREMLRRARAARAAGRAASGR